MYLFSILNNQNLPNTLNIWYFRILTYNSRSTSKHYCLQPFLYYIVNSFSYSSCSVSRNHILKTHPSIQPPSLSLSVHLLKFSVTKNANLFIMQCPNGHTLCLNCKSRAHNCCPTCGSELGNIRCLALERVAGSLELPCRHQTLGCHDIFPYYSKLKHEQRCRFRPYNCPYAGSECAVTGDIPNLVAHLKIDHNVDMHDGCTFNHRYVKSNPCEVENAIWMLTVSSWMPLCIFNIRYSVLHVILISIFGDL